MEYEFLPIEGKAAGKSHILRGTIVDTRIDVKTYAVNAYGKDTWIIKADVDTDDYGLIEDIIIFYHCQYAEKAGRAAFQDLEEDPFDGDSPPYLAMEGSPFLKDDRVIVVNYGTEDGLVASNLRVVGYEDGLPRQCVFQFRITRDDGAVVDRDSLILISIQQEIFENPGHYQTVAYTTRLAADDPNWTLVDNTWHYKDVGYYLREFSYNMETQIWTVPFMVGPYVVPRNNEDFRVIFACEDSITCMYSPDEHRGYVYKTTEFLQDGYNVASKFYEVKVPYFSISTDRTPSVYPDHCGGGRWCWGPGGGIDRAVVKSSIPYTVKFKAPDVDAHTPFGVYHGTYIINCRLHPPDCAACQVAASSIGDRWVTEGIQLDPIPESADFPVSCSNGASSNNLASNPIDSEQVITPPDNEVRTDTHVITLSYTGSGTRNITVECSDGNTTNFPVTFKYFKLDVYILITPNTT